MSSISSAKLIDLLPPNLRSDPDIIAASQALDKEFFILAGKIKNVLTFADIDNASSDVLDNLAWELNTDFYDSTLSIAKKRSLVKNALVYHFTKGTPYAIEQLLADAFDDAQVLEWFDYSGTPFYFKIVTSDSITTAAKLTDLKRAIDSVKRESTRLERITVARDTPFNTFFAAVVSTNDTIVVNTNIPE